jgi:hypothetical protein
MLPSSFTAHSGDRPHRTRDNPPESPTEPDADFISEFRRLSQIPGNAQHPLQAALVAHDLRRGHKSLCPACASDELKHEVGDRYGCQNCGSRCIVDDCGRTKDFMPWMTAGQRQRRRASGP